MTASRTRNKRGQIKAGSLPPGRIKAGDLPPDQHITFSFKHLHPNPPVSQNFPDGYWGELLRCLKQHSRMLVGEILGNRSPLRAHGIDWSDSNVPQGFSYLPEPFCDMGGFQLSVKRDTFGRIIGLLIGNVFSVCWLDPQHQTTGRQR